MARFNPVSGSEPLMKLERPTSGCSQSTAHLINAAFTDVLSAKPHDAKAVGNLAVSKRGESNYHDKFVDQLTQVSEKYNQRLALLSQLERHLVKARARALADDEKSLTSTTELWPTGTELNLPRGPSQFRKHLDEELLSRHNLLVPSKYLPSQPEHHKPPHETPPLYLSSTITASNHARKKPNIIIDTMAAKQTLQPSNPIWHNTLSLEERELEKLGLTNFNRKANYLRNSRYSKTKWSNTASSGPVRMRQSGQPYPKESMSFVAEPEEVQFTDYSVGETYEATLELKNISAVSRQLRLVPLKSAYFKVAPSACPTANGVVAPGLCASYTISFTPDSLENYQTDLTFATCNDEEVVIQLTGFRPPPILSIPDMLEAGYCLAGGKKTTLLECANTGGEGTFSLYKPDNTQHDIATSKLVLGPFTISPAQFYLPANEGVIPLSISFAPDKGVGEYSQQFNIACDNGQVMAFTVRGVAESVSVGCTGVGGEPLPPELELTAESVSVGCTGVGGEPLPPELELTAEDSSTPETVANPSINFDTVNPHNQSTGTLFIQNFSNVELTYHWRFYRPITEGPPWKRAQGDTPLINKLIPSDNTPFSVYPSSGSLVAKETKKFTFYFTPNEAALYVDMGYLVITGIDSNEPLVSSEEEFDWLRLSPSEVAVLPIQLSAVAKEFHVEMYPPALLIPYKLPLATETKKQVKFSNHSLTAVCYQWSKYECESVSVTVDPPHGRIEPGGQADLQVCICSTKEGSFSFDLFCQLENCDKTISLSISGKVEGPVVSVSVPCLDFGLVPVGRTKSLTFRVTSHTNCTLSYALRQLSEEHQDHFINIPCLSFSPCEGDVVPNGSATISVECESPGVIGKLKTIVEVLIDGQPAQHFWALATLQRPLVSLLTSQVHMDTCYVGIEVLEEVVLANDSPVPAQFTWSSQVAGEGARVTLSPVTGRIGPYQTTTVNVQTTWTKMNSQAEAILRCEILDMDKPIFLLLSAQVLGLSVSYSHPKCMNFGPSNKLGVPVSKTLTVANTSGIPAALVAQVIAYPSATPPVPPVQPKPDDSGRKKSRGRALLGRTAEKSSKQATSEYCSLLLREGLGCCFTVDPPSTSLPPFTSVTLTVTAHSDMWGEYTDQLLCKVGGLGDTVIPVRYEAVGCPIVFLSTATAGCTLARLGSHAAGANPVRRVLKIQNNSPVDIRVDWDMFNIVQNDNKYVDIIMPIGEAFPKASDLLGNTSEPTVSTPLSRDCDTRLTSRSESSLLRSQKNNVLFNDLVSYSESKLDNTSADEGVPLPNKQLITVFIKPHEGVRSANPFDIHPKQMVLPARGVSAVEVTFHPSVEALNQMGSWLTSYALGYLSLDNECPSSVTRKSVHDVSPLRIDIMAELEHVRLSLQCDEDKGLNFSYPASILLQDGTMANERVLTHHFTLLNPTSTVAEFKLATLTRTFTVSNICLKRDVPLDVNQVVTLKPQKSISFDISFTVCSEDLQQSTNEDQCTLVDSLQIAYSTGALQEFPLTSTLALPRLALSTHRLEFKTTHIDSRPSMATIVLSNTSMSDAFWNLEISSDLQEVVSVCPVSGVLPLHLTGGTTSTHLIRVEFSPRRECSYTGTVLLTEALTGRVTVVAVTGRGSADEKYIPTH